MSDSSIVRARFPGIGPRVFLFLFGAVLGTVVLFGAVAYKQGLFTPHVQVLFLTDDASGVNKGMPVKLRGFRIGSVEDMQIKGSEVWVTLSIAASYAVHVPPGSHARVSREGGIGASYLEVVPRSTAGMVTPGIGDGDVIIFDTSTTLVEMAEELKRDVQPMVNAIREALRWLNDPDGEVRQTIAVTREVLDNVPRTRSRVESLLGEASAAVSAVRESVGPIRETVAESLRASGNTIAAELPRIAATTSSALGEVAAAARELNRASRATGERLIGASERVSGAAQDARDMAMDASELAGAVKRTWPFNAVTGIPQTHTLSIDINESGFPLPGAPPGSGVGEQAR